MKAELNVQWLTETIFEFREHDHWVWEYLEIYVFFIYNLNQQSKFTFYKLMLWLLQCLDGESSSGESPVPQIMSIGQFLLSRLFSSLNRSFWGAGFRGFRV
jgi:hypothetical protein